MRSFVQVCSLMFVFICSSQIVHAEDIARATLRAKYDMVQGKEVYERACSVCHSSGVMDAPKFCDLTAWKPRMAHGMEAMVKHAVEGFNNMPAKGGMDALSLTESANAVAYMIDQCLFD